MNRLPKEHQSQTNAGLVVQTQTQSEPPSLSHPTGLQQQEQQPLRPNLLLLPRTVPQLSTDETRTTMRVLPGNGIVDDPHHLEEDMSSSSMFEPSPIASAGVHVVHNATVPVTDNGWSHDRDLTKEICLLQLQPHPRNGVVTKKRLCDDHVHQDHKSKKNKKQEEQAATALSQRASEDLLSAYQQFVGQGQHASPPTGNENPSASSNPNSSTTAMDRPSHHPWHWPSTTLPPSASLPPPSQQVPQAAPSWIPNVEVPMTKVSPSFPMMMMTNKTCLPSSLPPSPPSATTAAVSRPLIYAHHSMQPTYAAAPCTAISAEATAAAIAYNPAPDWQAYLDEFVLASDIALASTNPSSSSSLRRAPFQHNPTGTSTNFAETIQSSIRNSSLKQQQYPRAQPYQPQLQQQQGKPTMMHVMDPS